MLTLERCSPHTGDYLLPKCKHSLGVQPSLSSPSPSPVYFSHPADSLCGWRGTCELWILVCDVPYIVHQFLIILWILKECMGPPWEFIKTPFAYLDILQGLAQAWSSTFALKYYDMEELFAMLRMCAVLCSAPTMLNSIFVPEYLWCPFQLGTFKVALNWYLSQKSVGSSGGGLGKFYVSLMLGWKAQWFR